MDIPVQRRIQCFLKKERKKEIKKERKKESFFYKKLQHIKIIFLSFFLSFSSCQFSRHFTDPRLCISPFPSFSVFLAIFQFLQCAFLILHVFSVFLATFQLLQCVFLILHVFQFSHHIPGPTMWVSHFPRLSGFSLYSRSNSVCVSFSTFSIFLPYSRFYHVRYSFSTFFSFLAIFQVLQCVYLILHALKCFSPYSGS